MLSVRSAGNAKKTSEKKAKQKQATPRSKLIERKRKKKRKRPKSYNVVRTEIDPLRSTVDSLTYLFKYYLKHAFRLAAAAFTIFV